MLAHLLGFAQPRVGTLEKKEMKFKFFMDLVAGGLRLSGGEVCKTHKLPLKECGCVPSRGYTPLPS